MDTKLALTKLQATIIAVVIIVAALVVIYYATLPSHIPPTQVEVRIPRSDSVVTLDPAKCYVVPSIECMTPVYERLINYNDNGTGFEPVLAKSWEISPDGMTVTFYLRENVKFHDGTPFNATAVKFTFERILALQGGPAWMYSAIDKIEVVDTYTVKFVLKYPDVTFIHAMAAVWGPLIVSPSYVLSHATEEDPWAEEWMNEHMCGTGPYMVDEWVKGQYITFVRFPDYWRGWEGKHVDKIYMPIIREWATRRMMLEAGDLDMIFPYDVNIDDIDVLKENPDIVVEEHKPTLEVVYMVLNVQYGPCADIRVRKALNYLLDYDAVIEAYGGYAVQMQGPLPRKCPGHDDELFMYHYDPEEARRLLEEAGYSDGLEVTLAYLSDVEEERKIAEIFQTSASAGGVTVNLLGLTWPALNELIGAPPEQRPDIALYIWPPDYVDPLCMLVPQYKTGEWFAYGYSNPQLDNILEQIPKTVDPNERLELYKEAQRIIVEDVPRIWIIEHEFAVVRRSWLKGYHYNILYSFYNCDWYSLYIEGRT